jgi:TPR repeat protein
VEWKVLCQYFDAIKAEKNVSPEEWNDAKQLVEKRRQEKRQEAQTKVLKYYQDLADKGDAYGQFRLGQLYLAGDGVEKNEAKAREFFTKSAAQENKDAAAALEKLNHAKP